MCCHRHTKRSKECVCTLHKKQPFSLAATKAEYSNTAAVQQQRYTDSRAPSSCVCASSNGVSAGGWCTAGDRTTTTLTRPTQQVIQHTSSGLIPRMRSIQQQKIQGCVREGLWIPGKGMGVLHNLQKFRVRVWMCHRTHRSSRYCGIGIQNLQKFRVRYRKVVPVPRVLWHRRAELTEDPGTGMNVVQNLQEFRVRVRKCYITHQSSG